MNRRTDDVQPTLTWHNSSAYTTRHRSDKNVQNNLHINAAAITKVINTCPNFNLDITQSWKTCKCIHEKFLTIKKISFVYMRTKPGKWFYQ